MKLDELVPLGEATPFPDEETARLAAALAQASLRLNGYAAHGHLVHYPRYWLVAIRDDGTNRARGYL